MDHLGLPTSQDARSNSFASTALVSNSKRPRQESKSRRSISPIATFFHTNSSTVGQVRTSIIETLCTLIVEQDTDYDVEISRWMCTHLPFNTLRAVMLAITSSCGARALQRLVALFGRPPYVFLKPGDGDMIAAKGLSHSRVNFAYSTLRHVPNSAQFGTAQFVDGRGRLYRYVQSEPTDDALLGLAEFTERLDSSSTIHMFVRVQTQDPQGTHLPPHARLPVPRETLVLTLTPTGVLFLDAFEQENLVAAKRARGHASGGVARYAELTAVVASVYLDEANKITMDRMDRVKRSNTALLTLRV